MAQQAAPFYSGTDLSSTPTDPRLGGIQQDFDPSNQQPFKQLNDTFTRVDEQNDQAIKAQKQRDFQRQEQQRQFDHDILARQMAQDHEEKMLARQQALKDRQDLYNLLTHTGGSAATLTDENGNPAPMGFLPEDQKVLTESADKFTKKLVPNAATYKSDPDLINEINGHGAEHEQLVKNATMRSVYYKRAQIDYNNAYLPEEKQSIKDYMDNLQKQPLDAQNPPMPYMARPSLKSFIGEKERDPKNYVSFDGGDGVPNTPYLALLNTTDPSMINEGAKKYQFFKSQPEGTDPQAYQAYQQHLNELTEARGLPKIDLGGKVINGQLAFDDNTVAKRAQLARRHLAAYELTNNGWLQPSDEEDELKLQKTRADIAKTKAETDKLRTGKGEKPTAEQSKQLQYKTEVASAYKDVQKTLSDGIKDKPILKPQYPEFWKKSGIDPDQYTIYPAVSDGSANSFIGIPKGAETKTTGTDAHNKTTTKVSGGSESFEKAYPIVDNKTGERSLAFSKGGRLIKIASEKQLVANKLKHEANYDPKVYENRTAWLDEVIGGQSNPLASAAPANNNTFVPKVNGAVAQVRNGANGPEAFVGGAWKKIIKRNSKTGELTVQ